MKMDELAALMPNGPVTASPEVFQQLGAITRMLHDTLQQLGVRKPVFGLLGADFAGKITLPEFPLSLAAYFGSTK